MNQPVPPEIAPFTCIPRTSEQLQTQLEISLDLSPRRPNQLRFFCCQPSSVLFNYQGETATGSLWLCPICGKQMHLVARPLKTGGTDAA